MRLSLLPLSICLLWTSVCLAAITADGASLNGKTFYYVVVGGGTNGIAVASILSRDTSKKVLVIEAGGDTRLNKDVVSNNRYTQAFGNPELDWSYQTTPQQASGGKVYSLRSGRGLGGSSTINGAAFSGPSATQIDSIGALGNPGWSWSDLLGYMKRSQRYHEPDQKQKALGFSANMSAHGTTGPVDIAFLNVYDGYPSSKAFFVGLKQALNMSKAVDLAAGNPAGAGFIPKFRLPQSGDADTRVTAATAYLSPIEDSQSNLVVLINATATKMQWQPGSSPARASGVEFESKRGGATYKIQAWHVIVAAGAVRSPVFLEQSGVGSKAVLDRIRVPQVVDLAGVGTNLVEQQKNDVGYGPSLVDLDSPKGVTMAVAFPTIDQLMSNVSAMQAYVNANLDSWAQETVDAGGSASKRGLLSQYRLLADGIFTKGWPTAEYVFAPSQEQMFLEYWGLMTFSRGFVHARTSNAWDPVDIDPRYWSVPLDMQLQIEASRGLRKAFQVKALKGVIVGPETKPGFDASKGGIPQQQNTTHYGRYDRWQKWILGNFKSVWHLTGTCAMMPERLGGVVGSNFKVHKTDNVWVVDASILPLPISSHLTSVLYGVAEKAASSIKDQP